MTGPEHYKEAERLLAEAAAIPDAFDEADPAAGMRIEAAKVHVALANAAAIALGGYQPNGEPRSRRDLATWREVADTPRHGGTGRLSVSAMDYGDLFHRVGRSDAANRMSREPLVTGRRRAR
jgi:hypothetical protein